MSQPVQELLNAHFSVREEKADHHFRTEIPNIIYALKLDPHTFMVYSFLKKVAGDGGGCWMSYPNIANEIGISESTIKKSIKKLECHFSIIGNRSLITVYDRKKDDGSPDTNLIVITDIWRINGDYNREKEYEKLKEKGGSSKNGGVGFLKTEGGSLKTYKEEPSNKIQIKEVACMASPDFVKIDYVDGTHRQISKQDLYFIAEKFKLNWSTDEVCYLMEKLAKNRNPVVDLTKFCEAIIKAKRNVDRADKFSKEKKTPKEAYVSPHTPAFSDKKATRNFMDVLNEKLNEKKE